MRMDNPVLLQRQSLLDTPRAWFLNVSTTDIWDRIDLPWHLLVLSGCSCLLNPRTHPPASLLELLAGATESHPPDLSQMFLALTCLCVCLPTQTRWEPV